MGRQRGKRGEITVFLSMILLCVAGLICIMLESARTAGARCYLQIAANSSMDSLFSQYHRQLWQKFHLMGLEYGTEEDIRDRYLGFLMPYMETENWYPMTADSAEIEVIQNLTDGAGIWLEEEILAYMKYGIWNELDITPEDGEQFWKDVKEAASMQGLADSYKKESKEAWKLEQALDSLYACQARQQEHHARAARALGGEDSYGFFRAAGDLKGEIKKIPKLLKAYERQADKCKSRLEEMEAELISKEGDLTEERRQVMSQELEQYRSYIAEDGARRQEILSLGPEGERNLTVIEDVKGRVNEIESYLASLDEEDDDNSGPMWSAAAGVWNQIHISRQSGTGEKDEEKRGWLLEIENMVNQGLLELVIPPERQVSTMILDLTDAPSKDEEHPGETDRFNLITRVLVNEYCAMHFANFVSAPGFWIGKEAGTGDSKALRQQYQMEYLLIGGEDDRSNLADTVKQLLMVREGLNLIHILSDSQKREEAKALALVITGALGLTPLVEITAFFIMGVWALGESIVDLQTLLAGRKIPLLKGREDWALGLEQLLNMGQSKGSSVIAGQEKGLDYEGYLKLMLLLEQSGQKYCRMMDVMQMDIRLEQGGFLMKRCAYRVDMRSRICGKHVFFALPFVENMTGSGEHGYQMQVRSQKAY